VAEEEVDAVPLEVQEEEEEEEERHTLAFWEDQEEVDWGDAWEEAFQDALEVDGREEPEALEDLRFPSLAAVRMSVAARKAEAGDGAVKRSVHSFLHCLKEEEEPVVVVVVDRHYLHVVPMIAPVELD
jgi:hypothetical protein